MNLSVLYRGPLSSCNYGCQYCPFAKRTETKAQLLRDRQGLSQFVEWLGRQPACRWRVLFTPWGEALTRPWYRRAVAELTRMPHVESVAVQTNLSCGLRWMSDCRLERLAVWATYHPSQTARQSFLDKIERLRTLGVRVSAGMVGLPEFLEEIQTMRRLLPRDVYLWINAQQPRPRPYTAEEGIAFKRIDPRFDLTSRRLPSLGMDCRTGEVAFTVDGAGDMRRCHFVEEVIGNIHDPRWEQALRPRRCPKRFCDCFLGKAQLRANSLAHFFGDSLLERLPPEPVSAAGERQMRQASAD